MAPRNKYSYFTPFGFYGELFRLANQTNELLTSSAEVILMRSQIIQQAMRGEIPWSDPEFTLLWQEKMAAGLEASDSLRKMMAGQPLLSLGDMAQASDTLIKALSVSTKPYHTKVRANAKRLKGKKRRPTDSGQ